MVEATREARLSLMLGPHWPGVMGAAGQSGNLYTLKQTSGNHHIRVPHVKLLYYILNNSTV